MRALSLCSGASVTVLLLMVSLLPQGIDGVLCYYGGNCLSATPHVYSPSLSVEECCADPLGPGLRYRTDTSSEICEPCIVYGFSDSEGGPLYDLTLAEGSTVDITFGALKNEAEGRRFIEISSTPLPGTSSSGYSVQSEDSLTNDSIIFRITSDNEQPTVVLTAESDDIAVETPQGFELRASIAVGDQLENDLFTPPLRVTIMDINTVNASFTEMDLSASEESGGVTVTVMKEGRIGSNLTLKITPLSFMELEAQNFSLPSDPPDSLVPATSGLDFSNATHTVTFTPEQSVVAEMSVFLPITNDALNEAEEGFAVVMTSDQRGVQFTSNVALVRIIDNDLIRIGFAEESYDVVESNTVQLVELIKEDNVVTDQTFSVNIAVLLGENLVLADPSSQPTVPPDDVALSNVSNGQVELVFPPDKQSLQLELTVFDDSVLELNETVSFVLSGSTEFSLGQITESTVTILNDEDGLDFSFQTQSFNLSQEQGIFCFETEVFDDGLIEPKETIRFGIQLLADTFPSVISPSSVTLTIVDNDDVTVGFESTEFVVGEGSGLVSLNVSLLEGDLTGVSVTLGASTVQGSATSDDYSELQNAIVVLNGQKTSELINVSITNDNSLEADESFTVELVLLSAPLNDSSRVIVSPSTASLEITSDDAISGLDFQSVSTVLTFGPNESEKTVTVSVLDDSILEGSERFFVEISLDPSAPEGAVLGSDSRAVVTVVDNDVVTVEIIPVNLNVSETEGTTDLIVQRIGETTQAVTVFYTTVEGTATADVDFTSAAGDITILPNQTTTPLQVGILGDDIFEGTESFSVRLILPTGELLSDSVVLSENRSTANIHILDNDFVTIQFRMQEITVLEGDSATLTVEKIGTTTLETSVLLATKNSSAVSALDFIPQSTRVIFAAGEAEKQIVIQTLTDDIQESPEVFMAELSDASDGVMLENSVANISIIDNNDILVQFAVSSLNVSEGSGFANISVNKVGRTAIPVTVQFATQDGNAVAGADYEESSGSITFQPDEHTKFIIVAITEDAVLENAESFSVALSSSGSDATLGIDMMEVFILNNDVVVVTFEAGNYRVTEGGSIIIPVRLEGSSAINVAVSVTTSSGSALDGSDYTGLSQTIIFTPSMTEVNITVATIDDQIAEPEENFLVNLSTDSSVVQLGISEANVIIEDNDSVSIEFQSAMYNVTEGINQFASLTVVKTGESSLPVEVLLNTKEGSALPISDFEELSEVLQFSGSETEKTVTVIIKDDRIVEPVEQLTVELSLPSTPPPLVDVKLGAIDTTTVEIRDDDDALVRFRDASLTVREGRDKVVVVTVEKIGITSQPVTVTLATQNGTANSNTDFEAFSGMLQLQGNESVKSVEIDIKDDEIAEITKSFSVELSIPAGQQAILGSPNTLTVQIEDNDSVTLTFKQPLYTVVEGNVSVDLTVQLVGSSSEEVTGILDTFGGNATAALDYIALTSSIITLGSLGGPNEQVVPVSILADETFEGPEYFEVNLRLASSVPPTLNVSLGDSVAEVVIVDDTDDEVKFVFKEPEYKVREGTNPLVTVTVVKEGRTVLETSVSYATRNGTAKAGTDYIAASGTLVFSSGVSERVINVSIIDDDSIEVDEQFFVDLSNGESTTVVIEDNDILPVDTIVVNDTVIADPLLTVPLLIANKTGLAFDKVSLCYEIHGDPDTYFNFISDECASVNAHYGVLDTKVHVVDEVAVKAIDSDEQCLDIVVDAETCSAVVSGVNISGTYNSGSVTVRKYTSSNKRVRISLPNCSPNQLVLWVICKEGPIYKGSSTSGKFIKFVVARGLNLRPKSHGLIGQFWNIPVEISRYNYNATDERGDPLYLLRLPVTSSSSARQFSAVLFRKTWEKQLTPCFYTGSSQGGPPPYKIEGYKDSIIQGRYKDYIVSGWNDTSFAHSVFRESDCNSIN